jgi:flagellar motor switch protein FliG
MDLRKFALNAYKKGAKKTIEEIEADLELQEQAKQGSQSKVSSPGNKPKLGIDPPGIIKANSNASIQNKPSSTQPTLSSKTSQLSASRTAAQLFSRMGSMGGGKSQVDNEKGPTRTEIAKYMLIIGPEQASKILKHLPEDAIEAIVKEISAIRVVPAEERHEILQKFDFLFAVQQPRSTGGVETARGFLVQAFGAEKGEEFLRKALPDKVFKHFQFLEEYEPQQIFTLLKHEGQALRALVLSHLSPPKAAAVIKLMVREDQLDLIRRLSKMEKLDRDVLISVEEALKERIRKIGTVQSDEVDGKGVLAEILKNMDAKSETTLLEYLQEEDPLLSDDIKERLFTIETLLSVDDRDLQKILQEMENNKLALIMKGKSEEIRKKILTNLSTSRSQLVIEEYQYMGPKRRSEIDEVTRDFVRYLKRLEEEGKLVVRRDNEEYI